MALAQWARARPQWLPLSTASPLALLRARASPSTLHTVPFSTSSPLQKKGGVRIKVDRRITLIRYFLKHPAIPRPLRFSRQRHLRHWTIHRAWQLFKNKQRAAHELQLERQYMSMREACEALRLIGEDGLALSEPGKAVPPPGARDVKTAKVAVDGKDVELDVSAAAQSQTEVGRLYRIAMEKKGVWQGVPIEYSRAQTDTPSRTGWNHEWTR